MTFTVEEMTLLHSFDASSRTKALLSITEGIGLMQDQELIEQCRKLIEKLKKMPDAVFDSIDLTVYNGEDQDE